VNKVNIRNKLTLLRFKISYPEKAAKKLEDVPDPLPAPLALVLASLSPPVLARPVAVLSTSHELLVAERGDFAPLAELEGFAETGGGGAGDLGLLAEYDEVEEEVEAESAVGS
jgi:hypothetical protein